MDEAFKLVYRETTDTTVTIKPLPNYTREDILQKLRNGKAKCYETMIIEESSEGIKPIATVTKTEESTWDMWNVKAKIEE